MKKTIIILIIAVLTVIAAILIFRPQPATGITLFYGQECPHCARVEQYIQDNKIEEKVKIDKKEIYHDKANAQLLGTIASGCGKDTNQIGVPFLYDGKVCYEGEEGVKNFLGQYLGK